MSDVLDFTDAPVEGTSLMSNPKLAATLLLSYMCNACLFFDKNDHKFRRFLVRIRHEEKGNKKY